MGFFKFAFQCFDFFAWPLLALGYPLYASIRAIETEGNSNARKLVTYWVHFSLISLFEHAFPKLLDLISLWPYIRLLVVCWLVIPDFDGAHYVYKHLVRPCLFADPKIFIDWYEKSKNLFSRKDDLLTDHDISRWEKDKEKRDYLNQPEAEGFVQENEYEAIEKLIDTKSKSMTLYNSTKEIKASSEEFEGLSKYGELKGIKDVELDEKEGVTLANEITRMDFNVSLPEKRTSAPIEIVKTREVLTTCSVEFPQKPTLDQVQKEWTCAICQVTTQSETTLNSHLQGRRHKEKCEELKAKKNKTSKTKPVLPEVPGKYFPEKIPNESSLPKEDLKKCVSNRGSKQERDDEKCVLSNRQRRKMIKMLIKEEKSKQEEKEKSRFVENKESLWWCRICQVSCTCKENMETHLGGKKHLAKVKEL